MTSKFALVIANTDYQDESLAKLTAPSKDAEEFARILKSPDICAFDDIKILLNQPDTIVRVAIDEFFEERKPDDLLVLYFSGHGIRDEFGVLYLAVTNTNRFHLRSTAIKSDFIREAMDQSRSKRQMLILDCCNSGAFTYGIKAVTGGSVGTAALFEAGYGRVILTASDSTQFAWEGDKIIGDETANSLFTHFLVKGLEGEADSDGDGRITVDELYDYAYDKVKLATSKQTPLKFSHKQQGDIILRDNLKPHQVKPAALPVETVELLSDSSSRLRGVGIQDLAKLLAGKHLGLTRAAEDKLREIAVNDDSLKLRKTASDILADHGLSVGPILSEEEEKTEREETEKATQEGKELSFQNRILEAAIEKEVVVGVSTEFFVFIRRPESENIVIAIKRQVDEDISLDVKNIKARNMVIEFPVEKDQVFPAEITLKLTAQDFDPPIQCKKINIPPDGDSGPFSFSIVPKKTGNLLLNLEILKDETSLVNRIVRTTAIETNVKEKKSLTILSIPMVVFVQTPSVYFEPKQSHSVNVEGNVQGNIIIGDKNRLVQDTEREAAEKAASEKAEREASERAAREKTQREQMEREASKKDALKKTKREAAQKVKQKKSAGNSLPIALSGFGFLFLVGICVAGIFLLVKWLSPSVTPALTETPIVTKALTQESTVLPVATELPTSTEAPTLGIGSTLTGADGMTLLYGPAGEFTMGSENGDPDERPVHAVSLESFWIDQTEVTNKMYSLCVAAGACKEPANTGSSTDSRYYGNSNFDNYPVIYVDWNMAKTYCEWAGRELPTEAQWEKSARGTDANIYPWGNTFNGTLVNFCDTSCSYDWAHKSFNDNYADVSPVGNYPLGQSVYGTLDMAGNVWEWTNDWYDVYPGGIASASSNFGQKYRVLRGGSWYNNMNDVRSTDRYWIDLSDSFNFFAGFRCSRSP